jgi:hypothetical protein
MGKRKPKRKYQKPVSLHPLKPEDALSAFMKVNIYQDKNESKKGNDEPPRKR